ncbi:MAG TPA: hypothetical protein VF789_15800 [Thermoanaerobaculia bacterium]
MKQELHERTLTRVRTTREMLRDEVAIRKSALPAIEPPPPLALGIEGNHGDYRLAVRIQAASPGLQENIDEILERAKGEASVRVVGQVVKQHFPWHRAVRRPLLIGCSVGHPVITAGTLGCFVQVAGVPTPCILSNNHVLADENRASLGAPILQPGPTDGGTRPGDEVANLVQFEPLNPDGNLIDAALASLQEGIGGDLDTLTGLGTLNRVRSAPLDGDEVVFKIGRTTGLTRGRVSAFEVDDIWVGYDVGVIGFDRQIEIAPLDQSPFSLGGDSGSLIVDQDLDAVGLLFAGNDVDVTYANPIQTVLDTFTARLL